MTDKENKKIDEQKLENVSGGGFFSEYSDEDYSKAGVEVVGSGILWNDGYKFQGKEISTEDANKLAFFTYYKGYAAGSLQEAREFYDVMAQELYL